ncbi:lipopolysaccharide-induced tumor necrosis factor-alpha factor homolog isoform X4 [Xenopus laevis]|uniref:Lipopolysaccharide-induced tumor necrosis factor-alpha factor homolog isoform X4 n=2 Tax=Xenopus laevis TaxID=8355 RepID=A0A1L8EXG8_XENLA|nr:lipopolysaccharide-induced tumor necrosis factor-alpha factor homolog isoform X4 [Xenopus laevis]OCT64023.1 hypothetical protein XELAEV_18045123mg [Xenopus laevis]
MADANKINEPYSTSKHDEPTTEHHGIARLEITQLYPINMQNVLPIGPLGNFIPKITLPYRANMHNTLPLGPRGHFMPEITRIPYTANMHNALPLVPRGHFMPEVNQPHPVNMNNALPLVPLGNFRSAPMAPFSIYPVQAANNFRDAPAFTVCTLCQCQVRTRTEHITGAFTVILLFLFLLFGCWLGCCLIPCFAHCLKDVNHFCPNCNHLIHRFRRLQY